MLWWYLMMMVCVWYNWDDGYGDGKIEKQAIVMTLEPYGFHRLQTASKCLVVSWHSPCKWKPWKMMECSRDFVEVKGIPKTGGWVQERRGKLKIHMA
jgi:hypothetical protein